MSKEIFDILFLIARPAAGKSEIIDYLKQCPVQARKTDYHIGPFAELDDFPLLWSWFEEDQILERLGRPRLHTNSSQYFLDNVLWHVLIERLVLDYEKTIRDRPDFHDTHTMIVEFSRGSEHGGYREAFLHFPESMLSRGAILYVDVSWEESLRKNRHRFNPRRPDSILEHALSDEKLARIYQETDWGELIADDPAYVSIRDVRVPYAVFPNEDDVTTQRGAALGGRLAATLDQLWGRYHQLRVEGV